MSQQIHPAALPMEPFQRQVRLEMLRRGGPGGQHRNKVETAVIATHLPTGISAEAGESRSQAVNRRRALFRLRLRLALEVRLPAAESPSPRWQARCRDGRLAVNAGHEDFPALLAEALDVWAVRGEDAIVAAEHLGCTASQLVKLWQRHPPALAAVNRRRKESGLRPFR